MLVVRRVLVALLVGSAPWLAGCEGSPAPRAETPRPRRPSASPSCCQRRAPATRCSASPTPGTPPWTMTDGGDRVAGLPGRVPSPQIRPSRPGARSTSSCELPDPACDQRAARTWSASSRPKQGTVRAARSRPPGRPTSRGSGAPSAGRSCVDAAPPTISYSSCLAGGRRRGRRSRARRPDAAAARRSRPIKVGASTAASSTASRLPGPTSLPPARTSPGSRWRSPPASAATSTPAARPPPPLTS